MRSFSLRVVAASSVASTSVSILGDYDLVLIQYKADKNFVVAKNSMGGVGSQVSESEVELFLSKIGARISAT